MEYEEAVKIMDRVAALDVAGLSGISFEQEEAKEISKAHMIVMKQYFGGAVPVPTQLKGIPVLIQRIESAPDTGRRGPGPDAKKTIRNRVTGRVRFV